MKKSKEIFKEIKEIFKKIKEFDLDDFLRWLIVVCVVVLLIAGFFLPWLNFSLFLIKIIWSLVCLLFLDLLILAIRG